MKKRKLETFFIWAAALIILYGITYLDLFWLNKFFLQKEENIKKNIISLEKQISANNKIQLSVSENQLTLDSLITAPLLIEKIHSAFGENSQLLSLVDITQNESSPAIELNNIQSDQLHGNNIMKVPYVIKIKGDYHSLLEFSRRFSKEINIFVESMKYEVTSYPESMMTLKLKVYNI